MLMAHETFVTAEVEYRTARAKSQFPHHEARHESREERRRFRVPRRPSLHLPHPRRRPLSLA